MNKLPTLAALAMTAALSAQSPLVLDKPLTSQWPYIDDCLVYADITVNTQISVLSIDCPAVDTGAVGGNIEVWLTDGLTPLTQVFAPNLLTPGNWTQQATAAVTVEDGVAVACFASALVLNPGSYGLALLHNGVSPSYSTDLTPFATTELSIAGQGAVQGLPWAGPITFSPRSFAGTFNYVNGTTTATCSQQAAHTRYADGCYREQASWFELLTTAEANTLGTNSATVALLPGGANYLVLDGTGITDFLAPTAAATALTGFLPSDDDGEVVVDLTPNTFTGTDGIPVSQIYVHTNGIVSTQPVEAFLITELGVSFAPIPEVLVDAPGDVFAIMHDYNLTAANNLGEIVTEVVGSDLLITWNNVQSYPAATDNPSTVQIRLGLNTGPQPGIVGLAFNDVNATDGGDHLPLFSPAGDSLDHPEGDFDGLPVGGVQLDATDFLPMSLQANVRPVIGNTVSYTATNWTQVGPTDLGLHFASFGSLPPGAIELGPSGFGFSPADGCSAVVNPTLGSSFLVSGSGTFAPQSFLFPIPNDVNIIGANIFHQVFELDLFGGPNLIVTASNGLQQTVGSH